MFDSYYPVGGWMDYKGSFGTVKGALAYAMQPNKEDWFQIVDSKTGRMVKTNTTGKV